MWDVILPPLTVVIIGGIATGSVKLICGWITKVNTSLQETIRQLAVMRAEFEGFRIATEQATEDIDRRLHQLETQNRIARWPNT